MVYANNCPNLYDTYANFSYIHYRPTPLDTRLPGALNLNTSTNAKQTKGQNYDSDDVKK